MAEILNRVQAFPRRPFVAVACVALAMKMHAGAAEPVSTAPADSAVMEMMVKNALTALNHANITGNYTVLRDLGGEAFRERNSAADLAESFREHRRKHYDLSPILCAAPQFAQPPAEVRPGRLQLVGSFDTKPETVHFAVEYVQTPKGWALNAISVALAPKAEVALSESNR